MLQRLVDSLLCRIPVLVLDNKGAVIHVYPLTVFRKLLPITRGPLVEMFPEYKETMVSPWSHLATIREDMEDPHYHRPFYMAYAPNRPGILMFNISWWPRFKFQIAFPLSWGWQGPPFKILFHNYSKEEENEDTNRD